MHRMRTAAFAVVLLLACVGAASAQEAPDLVGSWQFEAGGQVFTTEFRADGTGTLFAETGTMAFHWQAEPEGHAWRLTLELEDDVLVAKAVFETDDRFVLTDAREGAPGRLADGDSTTFTRIAADATPEDPVVEPPAPASGAGDIYSRLGLDIATPEATVAAFVAAVQANDGLSVYFLLDPAARQEIWNALRLLDLGPVLGNAGASGADSRSGLEALAPYTVEEDSQPDLPFSIADGYPVLDAVFRWAAETGQYPVVLPADPVVGEPDIAQASDGQTRADVRIDGGGAPVVVHLRRSPAGNWRVLGVTHDPGGPDARTWLLNALR